jgi:zinc transport system substrate-binding protein
MRKSVLTAAAIVFTFIAAEAKINTYVSILPQKFFVQSIAGDKVNVNVMVMPGASPATYEPKPKQMTELSEADIYFSIGVPFEKAWLTKFHSINKDMKIVPTDAGIKKRSIENHAHEEEEEHHDHDHDNDHEEGEADPHIWLDPILAIDQTAIIADTLCKADSANCSFYKSNHDAFKAKALKLDSELRQITEASKSAHFMVFHPSWGYFADRYGLNQIAMELGGKEPKPSDMQKLITLAKKLKLNVIFIQPQFSKKAAELLAKETGAKIVAVNPLAENWDENLKYAAGLIVGLSQPAK